MSLSAAEYREHLETTAARAGFSFPDVVLPESREFHLGRMRFHYLDWGNKHLPTIVFLHGGALNAHTWDLCCLALRDDYHCLALDQRGHGDTDWADDADYSVGAQLADTKGWSTISGSTSLSWPACHWARSTRWPSRSPILSGSAIS